MDKEKAPVSPKRRIVRYVAIIAALALLVLLALPKIDKAEADAPGGGGGGGRGGPGGPGGGPPPKVGVQIVTVGTAEAPLILSGTLLPNEQVEITSEVSGKITGIYFSEGRAVAKGTVLARLNDADLKASLVKARSRLKLAELNEARKRALLERQGVSPAEYEIAVNELEVARAEIDLLEAQLDKTVIRAPFSGVIGLRRISEGAYVTPATVIATLHDVEPLKVEFSIPESYASSVSPGMVFHYAVQGIKSERTARVYAVEPALDEGSRSVRVRALSPNDDGRVMPGQYAAVRMASASSGPVPLIPTEAIVPTAKGQQVFVVVGGKAAARDVSLGARSDRYVEVLSGVNAGDTVITSGLQGVRDGAPVAPMLQPAESGG